MLTFECGHLLFKYCCKGNLYFCDGIGLNLVVYKKRTHMFCYVMLFQ